MTSSRFINVKGPPGSVVRRYLKPGQFFFCDTHCQLKTLLGSCIAITLWHPQKKMGGMCHFVLSEPAGNERYSLAKNQFDSRYLSGALALFEKEASRRGTALIEYQAKVFGGGNMLTEQVSFDGKMIGEINAKAAINMLEHRRIPIMAVHTGLTGYRQVIFELETGDVWLKHEPILHKDEND